MWLYFIHRQALIIYTYHKSRIAVGIASAPRKRSGGRGGALPVAPSAKVAARNRRRLSHSFLRYNTHIHCGSCGEQANLRIRSASYPVARNAACLASRGGASRIRRSPRSSRLPRMHPRDRRSSQCDVEKETARPVHFSRRSPYYTFYLLLSFPASTYLQRRRERKPMRRRDLFTDNPLNSLLSTFFVLYIYLYICISKPFRVEILIPLNVSRGG